MSEQERLTLVPDEAVSLIAERAGAIAAARPGRAMIGIAGGPGVGKSTIARQVVDTLNGSRPGLAVYVPMDGFHMRHAKLEALEIAADKGMPHTFEGMLFVEFLADLRTTRAAVTGPSYSREIEDVIEDSITVPAEARILVIEGNYLLLADSPWYAVRPLLDLAVFIHVEREKVVARLMKRHGEMGLFSEERNQAHVARVDMANYDLVEKGADRADIRIDILSER